MPGRKEYFEGIHQVIRLLEMGTPSLRPSTVQVMLITDLFRIAEMVSSNLPYSGIKMRGKNIHH